MGDTFGGKKCQNLAKNFDGKNRKNPKKLVKKLFCYKKRKQKNFFDGKNCQKYGKNN